MNNVKSKMTYQEYLASTRTAVAKKNKFTDYRGLNSKKNYSSFWMDDKWDTSSKFGGISTKGSQTSDLVKSVKLANYRRAITNFVKIVTKQDMPVLFHGADSYTDGRSITLSTDIKDSNFDVTVGLALHESSHIILTDFAMLKDLYTGLNTTVEEVCNKHMTISSSMIREYIKQMLNWVEDRRIDNHIFSTSPGYKAYYHKLYDYYWNSKEVLKGFISKDFRDATKYHCYEFHVINMINPNFNPNALPKLDQIASLVDLPNIGRLQSTNEALEIAAKIVDIILTETTDPVNQQKQIDKANKQAGSAGQANGQASEDDQYAGDGEESADTDDSQEFAPSEQRAINDAFQKQRNFLNGDFGKKNATKKLQRQLDRIAKQQIDIQSVGGEDGINNQSALMYDYTNGAKIGEYLRLVDEKALLEEQRSGIPWSDPRRNEVSQAINEVTKQMEATGCGEHLAPWKNATELAAIRKGLDMGALLGKKLQLHNEVRERVDNRLRSGKIDNRRLAHAGYGIESVFNQISIDAHKKANLHISLDGSGSMMGDKWEAAMQMTVAIAKAVSYTQNIDLQVSIRVTTYDRIDTPCNLMMYDSRKNKMNHLVSVLSLFSPSSMTPEGLCFEAMIKKNLLVTGDANKDSYFLNISDGQPGAGSYQGPKAIKHTAKQINKMRNTMNIKVLSFWIETSSSSTTADAYARLVSRFNSSSYGADFRTMYGKDASVVDSNSALMIARELNKKFLSN